MKRLRIAFVPLLRATFDVELAKAMIDTVREQLVVAGFDLDLVIEPVSDLDTAAQIAKDLHNEIYDLMVILQATFADSSMVTTLAETATAPVFLWALPEPWTGGRLRLNSLCGINLAAHALTLRNIKYGYGYGLPDDGEVINKIRSSAQVGALLRKLQSTKFGVVGEHPDGMDSCHLDQVALNKKFGVTVESIPLEVLFTRTRGIKDEQIFHIRQGLDEKLANLGDLDPQAVNGTLKVYAALNDIASENGWHGLAVRCWPEFFTELGCAACGAMSMLSDGFRQQMPVPCSCEADINGTLTQFILQTLSGKPAFGTDIVGVDQAANQIALWHCGLAPLSMADPAEQPRATIHSNRQLPLLMDFTLKPGKVTIARISRAVGDLQLVVGEGEMIKNPKPFSGTAGTLRLNITAKSFLDVLIHKGLEHHVSMTYGHYAHPLSVLGDWINLPVELLTEKEVVR